MDNLPSTSEKAILEKLVLMENNIHKLQSDLNELQINNDSLKNIIRLADAEIVRQNEEILQLHKQVNRCSQYSRRENIEIANIRETIPQNELEEYVINILKELGGPLSDICSYDIVAVHRIGKKCTTKVEIRSSDL